MANAGDAAAEAAANRELWTRANGEYGDEHADRAWAADDITPAQLATARRCEQRSGIIFPLIEADAGDVPLPSGSFDLAISECGASLWCNPACWAPQAARLAPRAVTRQDRLLSRRLEIADSVSLATACRWTLRAQNVQF
jgi:Methyltransferase domain